MRIIALDASKTTKLNKRSDVLFSKLKDSISQEKYSNSFLSVLFTSLSLLHSVQGHLRLSILKLKQTNKTALEEQANVFRKPQFEETAA